MGYHLYYFYDDDEQLMQSLSNFFMEGLRRREHCMWIPRRGVTVNQAIGMLKQHISEIEDFLLTDQMFIAEFEQWYLTEDDRFDKFAMLEKWKKRYEEIMARGYMMMRIAGDGSSMVEDYWAEIAEYEELVNERIAETNMIAVCLYQGKQLKPTQIHSVLSNHLCSLSANSEV
ncbi:MAG: MEDS domain-containing protein [Candidatus Omnitrophica bacterium]|nr:MEDS domain-containing protein [Candidatus Omnitrophota bacterium]